MTQNTPVLVQQDRLILGPVSVEFERTLRLPEKGVHPLPPGLGQFPIRRVAGYPDTAPADWLARGGVMLPVYQREAMWLSFGSSEPAALQVGVGKVCAVSGNTWTDELEHAPQNYMPVPEQPWLDGINSGDGTVRQFVAVPLGLGATVEGQVRGEELHGGVQLRAVGTTAEFRRREERRRAEEERLCREMPYEDSYLDCAMPMPAPPTGAPMGLGAGGRMRQEVYADRRSSADYDAARTWRVFVHLCSASQWTAITGEVPPPSPVDREVYVQAGLPWFDYYDADHQDLAPVRHAGKRQDSGRRPPRGRPSVPAGRSEHRHRAEGRQPRRGGARGLVTQAPIPPSPPPAARTDRRGGRGVRAGWCRCSRCGTGRAAAPPGPRSRRSR
ncbi:Uncharacterised protein [Tsukamurella paurometabola]|uniref:Integral membrane protein n=2 Tax=Tsukamurella paurometabola TaxID=2061 RepID=A0A3P8L4G3_TSUPA|nr:Uncharacterised protein [Tsukamurella paurometabola]